MSFYGSSFIFDGIPGEEYGLKLANIGGFSQSKANFGGELTIHEDRIYGRSTGLHYGATANKALSFPISFTVCNDNQHLDRYESAAVAGWLTGHSQYKWLSVEQEDMESIAYRCIITKLEAQEVGGWTVGYTATVTCDGPYAYRHWADTIIECDGSSTYVYRNMSNVNGYYRPVIEIECTGTSLSIANTTDGTTFALDGMTDVARTISIDCLNQVITDSAGTNLYACASGKLPRFLRGDNHLDLTGDFTMTVNNMFPWNIGN